MSIFSKQTANLVLIFFSGPKDVYALGDCAVQPEKPLPMIAQAAKQQAIYLGKVLNKDHKKPFRYNNIKNSSKSLL